MEPSTDVRGGLLARNTALNLLGQALPFAVGFVTIPYVIRGLGTDRFGVLAVVWLLLGYFSLFDLGLGRATTKFVADCLGRKELERIPQLVWTSLGSQVAFGLLGSLLVGALTPLLVTRILRIPPALIAETRNTLFLVAVGLPLVLATNGLRGVLEAFQRFDLVNYVKAPASIAVFVLPAIALPLGFRLPGIVLLLVIARGAAVVAYLICCIKVFPALARKFVYERRLLRGLLGYGGWITVSNVLGPLLNYMDRFFIASLLTITALGYYTPAYEVLIRIQIIPASLVATLFPAFAVLGTSGSAERMGDLFTRSLKFLVLVLGPVMVLAIVYAREFLWFWLGPDFAEKGTRSLQFLALGVLINSFAFIPFTLLQALDRPDLAAKIQLLLLAPYAGILWVMIPHWGIASAAAAWTLRATADTCLMFGACLWLRYVDLRTLFGHRLLRAAGLVLALGIVLHFARLGPDYWMGQIILTTGFFALFAGGTWVLVLDKTDKGFVTDGVDTVRAALTRANAVR
jgi:O-antigen/teichoic acid export membrane protein